MTADADVADGPDGWVGWAGVVVLCLAAALAAWVECLLVPLYIDGVLAPVAVVVAVASNIALPRMARNLVPRTIANIAPLVVWLIVMVIFGVNARPEGDVVLPGGGGGVQYVTYGVLLGGALIGTITVVVSAPMRAPRSAAGARRPAGGPTKRR